VAKKVITKRIRRAVLFGPLIPSTAWISRKIREYKLTGTDLRIGVDGGVKFWSDMNIPPEIVIGDWDSLGYKPEEDPNNQDAQNLTLLMKKERSDLHYALEVLNKTEIKDLLLIGFTGGRPDHHLSNLMELAHYAQGKRAQKIATIGPEAEYYWVSPTHPLELRAPSIKKGQTLSIFAWEQAATGVVMEGLEYRLKMSSKKQSPNSLLPSSRGLSNVVKSDRVFVSVKKGLLLVVIPSEGRR
jgi:thiamine pyrophosphokinase